MTTFRVTVTVAATLWNDRDTGEILVKATDREDAARKARQWANDKHWRRPLDDIDVSVTVH